MNTKAARFLEFQKVCTQRNISLNKADLLFDTLDKIIRDPVIFEEVCKGHYWSIEKTETIDQHFTFDHANPMWLIYQTEAQYILEHG